MTLAAAMQRGDLPLWCHVARLGRPVIALVTAPVPRWVQALPNLRDVVDPATASVPTDDTPIVVVVDEAIDDAALVPWREAGAGIVRRHGAGWRIEPALPTVPGGALRERLARWLPIVAGWFGVLWLRPPFRPDGGHSRWVSLRGLRLPRAGSGRVVVAFEDGRPLSRPDSIHDEIRKHGGGRYSVWDGGLYFSASDGSDPATNGRRYEARVVTPGQEGELTAMAADGQTFEQRLAAVAATRSAAAPAGDRVLIVISSLGPGGAERQFAYLARGLAQLGRRVGILSLDGFDGVAGHYLSLLRGTGVELLDGSHPHPEFVPPPHSVELLAHLPEVFAADVWRIASHTRVFAPDVLHTALDKPNVLGAIAGLCLGVPRIVLSMRNVSPSHIPRLNLPWLRRWYQIVAAAPGVVLSANSRAGAVDYAAWLELPAGRITTVHNGMDGDAMHTPDDSEVHALRGRLGLRPDDPVVVGVFRISEEKRPMLWLEVITVLRRRFPRLQALHVGDGPDAAAMDARIGAPDLRGAVHRLGRLDDPGVAVRAADLLLLVSAFEGVPNVMLETQWLERPVVCTAAGGSSEAVQHGVTGYVVDEPEPEALATACAQILCDRPRGRQMGEAGRRFVGETFAVARMIAESADLYR